MRHFLLLVLSMVVASAMAADPTVNLNPPPLPAKKLLVDMAGNLVKEDDCRLAVAKCVKYVRKGDPTFDAYMNPLIRAFGTTQGAFLFDKCMHGAGVETRLVSSGGGTWDEYVPPAAPSAPTGGR